MTTDPDEARQLLTRAHELEQTSRRATAYLATYFAIWGVGSLVLGLALWVTPLVGDWWPIASGVVWLAFVGALSRWYWRGRSARPLSGPAMTLGMLGGSLPWSAAAAVTPLFARPENPWWLHQANFPLGGLACCVLQLAAAVLARRQAR